MSTQAHTASEAPLRVALVNNMPDAAFVDTEEQFRAALGADGRDLALHAITEIPRGERVAAVIAQRYRGLDALWEQPPEVLIVTGTEPAQAQLPYEPYWPYLARLLEWAVESVPIAMLSCLAAHASILLFDGIERRPRPRKLSGVYSNHAPDPEHPLARGLPARAMVPHSRLNDVGERELEAAGYELVLCSPRAGWSIAARRQGRSTLVLCQGHPEYSPLSLLREYRRDVRRSLFSRGAIAYPPLPEGYMAARGERLACEFGERARAALGDGAEPAAVFAGFPYQELAETVRHRWARTSSVFYANWVALARASRMMAGSGVGD
jgi:homoserine O-succinyltransferase